jgi:hypothetical protein
MRRLALSVILAALTLPSLALAQTASPPAPPPGMGPPPPPGAPPPYAQPPAGPRAHPAGPGDHHWHHGPGEGMQRLQAMFAAANTTHDGHLTFPQAQAANMKPIVDHFAEIDTKNRGYITLNDIIAWHLDRMAQKLEQRAAALRAQD